MPNILLVDDEKSIRKTLREILEYEKYKVDEAEDGPSALEKIQNNQYDVVLLDIKMPKMDGLEVLEKAREVSPDTSYIMISGHGNIETAVEATKKGAFDFISKPPDLNRLLITVRNAMDKNNLVTETKILKRKVGLENKREKNRIPADTKRHRLFRILYQAKPYFSEKKSCLQI